MHRLDTLATNSWWNVSLARLPLYKMTKPHSLAERSSSFNYHNDDDDDDNGLCLSSQSNNHKYSLTIIIIRRNLNGRRDAVRVIIIIILQMISQQHQQRTDMCVNKKIICCTTIRFEFDSGGRGGEETNNYEATTTTTTSDQSILNKFANGLETTPLVGQVERLEHVGERGVPAADTGHGRFQMQKATVLKRQPDVSSLFAWGRTDTTQETQLAWMVDAISAAKPDVSGASCATSKRPVLTTL